MGNMVIKTNEVRVDGIVHTTPEYSHTVMGEQFYQFELAARRKSGVFDFVPVTVSDRAFDLDNIVVGTKMLVIGSFRSFNKQTGHGNKLLLSVFASQLDYLIDLGDENKIWMTGTICKPPVYRRTPFGREITDLILGINRDYINQIISPVLRGAVMPFMQGSSLSEQSSASEGGYRAANIEKDSVRLKARCEWHMKYRCIR